MRLFALCALLASAAAHAQPQVCRAESGAQRNALVELYTSEGCSSCPPADRQLSLIGARVNANVVPLALHVDFWDAIGWKDPFAQAAFTERQRWLIGVNGSRTLYTPHFFVGGTEIADRSQVATAIRRQAERPAGARVRLESARGTDGTLEVRADAEAPGAAVPLALYAALTESGLESRVTAGENRGERLAHDHVVRQWIRPVPFTSGRARLAATLPAGVAGRSKAQDLVVFVQNTRTGEVLQALRAPACAAG